MKQQNFSILRRIAILIFVLITVMCTLFITITYFATIRFYEASTQLLNKDVAAHIAKFSSPFEAGGINKEKADSVFQNAMVISPSDEVYFLDTTGKVIAFHAPTNEIRLWQISPDHIRKYIADSGTTYIKGPDPKDILNPKIFSASEVKYEGRKLGYIYVILGSNEYRNVSQMLFSSHVSNLAGEAFCIILLLSALISFIYLRRVEGSFRRVTSVLKKFEEGDYDARFHLKEHHELAPVTNAFNKMADQLVYNINSLQNQESSRKDFIAHISHDLRTPLSIARGYTETLLIKGGDGSLAKDEQEGYKQMILNKIFQVEHMVTQLFELSKIESAAFRLNKEPFVLSEIVQEIVYNFQMSARDRGVKLECAKFESHIWVNADIHMLERVIQNLVENAIKNTDREGTTTVNIEVSNDQLVFTISNSGSILKPGMVEWINSTEKQNNSYDTRPSKSGLGLMIVKRILLLHASLLQVRVNENQNIFSFSLPIVKPGL
jgi:signal transduction histidine kinase